ncbi:hypothetical protein [Clostridium sp.]|uniref:hypothetical protein n=1 Tax=Clostridium sp. TaxID=1506 RepID=UPI001A5B9DF9|nr:hypothetical protein [Clostridium sp.]MBK5241120.1 hypothetical protein [Clostridium sp.]
MGVYIGTGEFDLFNYKTKDAAEEKILDLWDNIYITLIFIVYLELFKCSYSLKKCTGEFES